MADTRQRFRNFFTDRRSALILRWWAAGAVYFFIGWGTSLGNQSNIIDFVFTLGVVMGLFNMIIVNPGLRMAFNLSPQRRDRSNPVSQRVSDYLVEIIKNIFIMLCVALIYIAINSAVNAALGLPVDNIALPGEPILFGVFYVLMWALIERLTQRIVRSVQARQGSKR